MNLFVVGWNLPQERRPEAVSALQHMVEVYPQLDPTTLWHHCSACGTLFAASMHTAPRAAEPRSYVLRHDGEILFYSGLPVDPGGTYPAHQAQALSAHWHHLSEDLEGQHVILRLTDHPLQMELLTDFLGMEQVFYHQQGDQWLISNSVGLIERISGASTLDPLGLSLFLCGGWAGAERTLLRDIRAIPGGQHWTWQLEESDPRKRTYFSPADLARLPKRTLTQRDAQDLADDLMQLLRSLALGFGEFRSPLTGGRDSRLLAALLHGAGLPAQYHTAGIPSSTDVRIGSLVAKTLGLPHEIITIQASDVTRDWENLCERFVRQNDGLSSLWQVADTLDQPSQIESLDLSLWGAGGEIARNPYGKPYIYLGKHRAADIERFLIDEKLRMCRGLVHRETTASPRDYVHQFATQCMDWGFSPLEALDVFYLVERAGRWGGNNARRVMMIGDLFSPCCSRSFARAAFSLPLLQRYTELLHYTLIRLLAPSIHGLPLEAEPWAPQRPMIYLASQYGEWMIRRLRGKIRRQAPRLLRLVESASRRSAMEPPSFDRLTWFEAKREQLRALCLDQPSSPLWDYVDRPRFEQIMSSETAPARRSRNLHGLYNIVTVFYYQAQRKGRTAAAHARE